MLRQAKNRKYISPGLRPGISQQMRGNRTIRGHGLRAIFLRQPRPHKCVERKIEWPHLLPESVQIRVELLWRHIVTRSPENAGVFKSQIARALVRKIDEARIFFTHRRADRVPTHPYIFEL